MFNKHFLVLVCTPSHYHSTITANFNFLMLCSPHFRAKLRPFVDLSQPSCIFNLDTLLPPEWHPFLLCLHHSTHNPSFPLLAHATFTSGGHAISPLLQYFLSCWLLCCLTCCFNLLHLPAFWYRLHAICVAHYQ